MTIKEAIMIRTFRTHEIRKQTELSSSLWNFRPCEGPFSSQSRQVLVPGCWESYPEFSDYRGKAVYSRTIECSGKNIRLEFKGISHTAHIFLDGEIIGSHYNAYTPFSLIRKRPAPGTHLLEVIADNRFSEDSSLHIPNDYYSYGGISRGVLLEELEDLYLSYVHITPVHSPDGWSAQIEVCVENLSDRAVPVTVCSEILGHVLRTGPVSVPASGSTLISGTLPVPDAPCWSPESSQLCLVRTTLYHGGQPVDDLIERTGFRTVAIDGNRLLLNGRPLRIKGFCRHEDHPQFGCALPLAAIQYDLDTIRHLGANSIRTSHYPNDELFLDLCDELGILVWEENHARGLSEEQMKNPNFEKQCEDCIREMITAHYNHPSIYIWGILNECASDTEYGRRCYQKQYEQIRILDPNRPRSSASCRFKTDLCLGEPEVVSYNIYPEWYVNRPTAEYLEELYRWVQEESEGTGKPFLITEVGAGAVYGYRTPTQVKWSEEYQAKALEHQLSAILSKEECCGVYIWQYADVRVSEEWFASRPKTMNNKGIVDEYRRRKLSYEVVKRIFESYGNYFAS